MFRLFLVPLRLFLVPLRLFLVPLRLFLVPFLLFSFAAWGLDAPPDASADTIARAKVAIALQQAQNAAAVPAAPSPVPVVQAAPIVTTVTIPQEVQAWISTFVEIVITTLIGMALTWLRSHLKIMQDATMNTQITNSALAFGGMITQRLQAEMARGPIDIHSPTLQPFVQTVLSNYAGYAGKLGMTPERVAGILLKGAANVQASGVVVTGVPVAVPDQVLPPVPPVPTSTPVSVAGSPVSVPTPTPVSVASVGDANVSSETPPSWPTGPAKQGA